MSDAAQDDYKPPSILTSPHFVARSAGVRYDLEKDMSKKPKVNKTKEMEESGDLKKSEKEPNLKKKE